jgi:hypothetical protein
VYTPEQCCIEILLDSRAIDEHKLDVTASGVRSAILKGSVRPSVLKSLKDHHVIDDAFDPFKLTVFPPEAKDSRSGSNCVPPGRRAYFQMQASPGPINKDRSHDAWTLAPRGWLTWRLLSRGPDSKRIHNPIVPPSRNEMPEV